MAGMGEAATRSARLLDAAVLCDPSYLHRSQLNVMHKRGEQP